MWILNKGGRLKHGEMIELLFRAEVTGIFIWFPIDLFLDLLELKINL